MLYFHFPHFLFCFCFIFHKGRSVVVDNQNKTRADRAPFISAALSAGAVARAVRIDVPKELCFHLNEYRALNSASVEHRGSERVPDMVIHSFFKGVEEPTLAEGFTEVHTVKTEHLSLDGISETDRRLITSFL